MFIAPNRVPTTIGIITHKLWTNKTMYVRAEVFDQYGKLMHPVVGNEVPYLGAAQKTMLSNFIDSQQTELDNMVEGDAMLGVWTLTDLPSGEYVVGVQVIGAMEDGTLTQAEHNLTEFLTAGQSAAVAQLLADQRAKAVASL